MRYISMFSGIEAASVAWKQLGWEPVAFSEIEPFPCALLKERFPTVPNLGDITKIDWTPYVGAVDLIVGGSPCQSFSIAGNREGLRGESGLMFEFIRAVREVRPAYFVWENVPGALSCEGGAAFGQLLREMDDIGYGLAWRVLDAQFFGVPQRRRRIFLVGSLGNMRCAEILSERESLCWDNPSSRDKREALAESAEKSAGSGCYTLQVRCGCAGGGKGALIQNDVSATLSTSNTQTLFQPSVYVLDRAAFNQGKNAQYEPRIEASEVMSTLVAQGAHAIARHPDYIVRKLTPLECERLQGFPDGWTDIEGATDTQRYKALGNSMAVPNMLWIGERIQRLERMNDGKAIA